MELLKTIPQHFPHTDQTITRVNFVITLILPVNNRPDCISDILISQKVLTEDKLVYLSCRTSEIYQLYSILDRTEH